MSNKILMQACVFFADGGEFAADAGGCLELEKNYDRERRNNGKDRDSALAHNDKKIVFVPAIV